MLSMNRNIIAAWGVQSYLEDIVEHLKERETHRWFFLRQSTQVEHRKSIVECLKEFAEIKQVDRVCLHLAVYLLDLFMDYHILPEKKRLYQVATVCLLLAAKLGERDTKIPKIVELRSYLSGDFEVNTFKNMEVELLEFLEFSIAFPTASHFVDYFSLYVVLKRDCAQIECDETAIWAIASEIINECLNIILFDLTLTQSTPSLVAASVMAATRNRMSLEPVWTQELRNITGYEFVTIKSYMKILLCFLNTLPKNKCRQNNKGKRDAGDGANTKPASSKRLKF